MGGKKFFILIIMILFTLYLPTSINQKSIDKSRNMSNQYHEVIVNATSDATRLLVDVTDSYSNENMAEGNKVDYRDINLNLDKALDRFYKTLYLNLNIEESYSYQEQIKHRIPIKIATAYEGYYINYFKMDGKGEQWSELKPYSLVEGELVIHFTLDDNVTVTDGNTNTTITAKRQYFEKKYPNSCLKDQQTFDNVKSNVINSMIQEDLEYYTSHSNSLAKLNGWNIVFDIPYWGNRSINSIAFIAFYQGDEFIGTEHMYNSYGYSTSKTTKNKFIYGYIKNGKKLYSYIEENDVSEITIFNNQFEAAKAGYSPDSEYFYK